MPKVFPNSGTLSFTDIQTYFGGSPPITLAEYYAGASYTPNFGTVPTSGPISLYNFFGSETSYTNIVNNTASGSFTVPTGINRLFVVIVGGGGGRGGSNYITSGDGTQSTQATGAVGGWGGLAMCYQNVTPGSVLPFTVGSGGSVGTSSPTNAGTGGTGGSSIFNGITATGGLGGQGAYTTGSFGSNDKPTTIQYFNGTTVGANGTSSGTNYITTGNYTASLLGTAISSSSWLTYYDLLIGRYVGSTNTTNVTNLTTARNQTAATSTGTLQYSPTGSIRPGRQSIAGNGAVLIYY